MPATANRKTKPRLGAEPLPPLSWVDVVSIQDHFGIQPARAGNNPGDDAVLLHSVYTDWVRQSGAVPTRPYVMPLSTVIAWLRRDLDFLPRHETAREVRRVLVDGLNDPHCEFSVVVTPSTALRGRRP